MIGLCLMVSLILGRSEGFLPKTFRKLFVTEFRFFDNLVTRIALGLLDSLNRFIKVDKVYEKVRLRLLIC